MRHNAHTTRRQTGVALLAVLAILTVLAVLAAAFSLFMSIEKQIGSGTIAKVQADMLAYSAVEHAASLLRNDAVIQPAWDDYSEEWHSLFVPVSDNSDECVDVDGLPASLRSAPAYDARWITVRDTAGMCIGRYAVLVEDEAGKININTASALSSCQQNQGVGTFEILLTDGRNRGLPFKLSFGNALLAYRYGQDSAPGQLLRDDNRTENPYSRDGIDNDADQVYDERGEGIDEPEEYRASKPVWDDRAFASVDEMCDVVAGKSLSVSARRLLHRYATISTRQHEAYWDGRDGRWHRKVNLNSCDRNQLIRVLRRANDEQPFEPSSGTLRGLAANVIDYRDENHVLTTLGSDYGVEAICFNEIMANDRSMEFLYGWGDAWIAVPELVSPCKNTYYYPFEHWWDPGFPDQYWGIRNFSRSGSDYEIRLKTPVKPLHPQQKTFYSMELPWPADFWYGGQVLIYQNSGGTRSDPKLFDVVTSHAGSERKLTIRPHDQNARNFANSRTNATDDIFCFIKNGWSGGWYDWTCYNRLSSVKSYFPVSLRTGRPDFYYKVFVMRETLTKTINPILKELDMDGDTVSYSVVEEDQLKYLYKGGEPQRANQYGYIPVTVTSSKQCSDTDDGSPENRIATVIFNRPDVVELLNVSDHPVSLLNWNVVVNTGVDALTLATIDTACYYSSTRNGRYDDPNPVIKPNGYFYLTNNREIFDREYCDGDGIYGGSSSETIPVYELPDKTWGITYRIVDLIFPYEIKVEGADWQEDQLRNELFTILTDREESDTNPNGLTFSVLRNSRSSLFKGRGQVINDLGIEIGDYVMILGLPRQGGFVSFTLKNEYNQVTARTTEYGSVEEEESGYSTEKVDPTHYTWIKNITPRIGGTERKARNRGTYVPDYARPHIKNSRFTSPAEILDVRSAVDWENIGSRNGSGTSRALKALTKYLTVSGIRLEAEEDGAHVSGWLPAFGTVVNSAFNTVFTSGENWPPGIWNGRKLTFISGALNGEEYIITNNTGHSLSVRGYSTASGEKLAARSGDRFMIGPGYSTPQYYTRRSNEDGIWEWRWKNLEPGSYGLYLFGLNDSIATTEFLEENWNAELNVAVFNYNTRVFNDLPLQDNRSDREDFITMRTARRLQYDKSDGVYCGMIGPEHISSDGGIQVRITAHNLENRKCSGFAWFDYACLAPVSTPGKININTADERIVSALKNITPQLARNIVLGLDSHGNPTLKPYRDASDFLDINGCTPQIYRDICNILTTRSDQYRVVVIAQAVNDVNRNGSFERFAGDRIISESRVDVIIDRSELTDGNPETQIVKILR